MNTTTATELGIVALLIAVIPTLWAAGTKIAKWVGERAERWGNRLVESHTDLVDSVKVTNEKCASAVESQSQILVRLESANNYQSDHCKQAAESNERIEAAMCELCNAASQVGESLSDDDTIKVPVMNHLRKAQEILEARKANK